LVPVGTSPLVIFCLCRHPGYKELKNHKNNGRKSFAIQNSNSWRDWRLAKETATTTHATAAMTTETTEEGTLRLLYSKGIKQCKANQVDKFKDGVGWKFSRSEATIVQ
jgi:hypothetical protein